MKKTYLLTLCSAAALSLSAADYNITGGTSTTPAEFSDAAAWGGTLPTFDKNATIVLNGVEGESAYFTIDEDITIAAIKTQAGINGDFYLNAEGKTVTIDAAKHTDEHKGTDILTFSNGTTKTATGTFGIGKGTYNIISTAATNDIDTIARVGVVTYLMSGTLAKNITIDSGAVINAYTQLALSGTVGGYGAINIAGEVNTFENDTKGEGKLIIDWMANPYETGGGTRTQVNVLNGGSVSTGTMLMKVQSKMDVKEGATLNVSNTLSWELSSTNPGGILNTYGTTYIKSVDMAGDSTANSGAMQINVKGGVTTLGTVLQTNYKKASINVTDGTLNVTDAYQMDTAELNVKGGTANVANLTQTGGTISVTGGTLNLSGTNAIASNTSISSAAGSNIVFKSGSNNTFVGSASENYSELKGNVKFESGSTLITSDRFSITNGTWYFDGAFVNTKTASGNWQSLQLGNASTTFTFGENATLTANTGNRFWISDSTMIINSATNSIKTTSFVLGGNAKLFFNNENSVVSTNNKYETSLNLTVDSKATITLTDTQVFKDVLFQGINIDGSKGDDTTKADTLAKLTLDLQFKDADDYISFTNWHASYQHGDGTPQEFINVYVKNFENNRIFFSEKDGINVTINLFDAKTEGEIRYTFELGEANGVPGYWMNISAVPEPAEWAAIFGAIALGLAIYRKRK